MIKNNLLENKEIYELKNKCKLVQNKISKVVESIPVRNIINNISDDSNIKSINIGDLKKEDEKTGNMQS